jgi:hypothetical protein
MRFRNLENNLRCVGMHSYMIMVLRAMSGWLIDIVFESHGFRRSLWTYLLHVSLELLQDQNAQTHFSIVLSTENYVLMSFGLDLIQRHEELKADNISLHSTPVLCTPWVVEKQTSLLYTQKLFNIFQEEVNAARDHCFILQTTEEEFVKYVIVGDVSMRNRVVQWCIKDILRCCSCKLFEKIGILCRHIILTLRGEISMSYLHLIFYRDGKYDARRKRFKDLY